MKPFVVANWKMNFTLKESEKLMTTIISDLGIFTGTVVVCPSFVSLSAVSKLMQNTSYYLGAQSCFYETDGAYTGEVSPRMLKDVGCQYVLVGHSERRTRGESNDDVRRKLVAVMAEGLTPILCVGESLADRKAGTGVEFVQSQLRVGLSDVSSGRVMVAYEPIWAIGTGVEAQAEQTIPMLQAINATLGQMKIETSVLYGGSVQASNARRFVDEGYAGVLVGSASWQSESFVGIVKAIMNEEV